MVIYSDGNDILMEVRMDFDLKHIFECGQCFRWNVKGHGYAGVAMGTFLEIHQTNDHVRLLNTSMEEFNRIWRGYFDVDRDYEGLKKRIAEFHPVLGEAVDHGYGIRLLRQEPWETLVSFIISSNNNIPRIKSLVEKLAYHYGDLVAEVDGVPYFSFPTPLQLAHASETDLRNMGLGYRAKYIHSVVHEIVDKQISLESYQQLKTKELEKALQMFKGVGPKVASCIVLFGYHRLDAFPVDTWIRKVVSRWFQLNPDDGKGLESYIDSKFEGLEGLVQQYLFYYAREHKLD